MDFNIIVDSCCDLTPEMTKELKIQTVPLTLTLGEESFIDDDTLNLPNFMQRMRNYKGRIGSACPSPMLFKEAFIKAKTSFAVTLSCHLSGTYASAMAGKQMAEEEGADVYVFDSKSASAGETLVATKIRSMMDQGHDKGTIISYIEGFIKEMRTYFVLENIDNLVKNGRLNKIVGKIISALNIKPLMGSDLDGNIALFSYARGQKQIIEKLADTVEQSGKETEGQSLVISHCNNPGLAEKLLNAIKNRYHFKEIIVVPTRGVSSLYANDQGIVMAY